MPRIPKQMRTIIGSEACERFSFYGMRAILVIYMTEYLAMAANHAKIIYHLFMAVCYLLPLAGAWIADRIWGRYKTILYLSIFYCIGHAVLAVEENRAGLYMGLLLIAVGSGGIKPCVSAFVGDQVVPPNPVVTERVYAWFYWIINFGAFIATLAMPYLRRTYGPSTAFTLPGLLMGAALFTFWVGNKDYVKVAPSPADRQGFLRIVVTAARTSKGYGPLFLVGMLAIVLGFFNSLSLLEMWPDHVSKHIEKGFFIGLGVTILGGLWMRLRKKHSLLDHVRHRYESTALEDAAKVLMLMPIFGLISVFWTLNDQHGSTWVLQGQRMVRSIILPKGADLPTDLTIEPDQLPALNPILVMIFVPLFDQWLYPRVDYLSNEPPEVEYRIKHVALRRMMVGLILTAISFMPIGLFQHFLDQNVPVHILWQSVAYVFLMAGEVMVYGTGLEFAYSQAPRNMKSTVMSLWLLTAFFGNLLTALLEKSTKLNLSTQFWLYGALMFIVALIFGRYARSMPLTGKARATA